MRQTETDNMILTMSDEGIHMRFLAAIKMKSKVTEGEIMKDEIYLVFESYYDSSRHIQTVLIKGDNYPFKDFHLIEGRF